MVRRSNITRYKHYRGKPNAYEQAWNTTRNREYLAKCQYYLNSNTATTRVTQLAEALKKGQQTLKDYTHTFTERQKEELDTLQYIAMFTLVTSFKLFNTPNQQAVFKKLGYTPPTSRTIRTTQLDAVYESTKERVIKVINTVLDIRLVVNESDNIKKERIKNTLVIVKG